MKSRARELVEQGDRLLSKRGSLLSYWQAVAEQFYPERADFIRTFTLGEEFASNLMTGAPVMARRDLANQFHAMLRPRDKPWFHARTLSERINEDTDALKWLDWASGMQRGFMYDREAHFIRATTQGDHDFAAFGQTVIQVRENEQRDGLLYLNWHLRDTAWCENSSLVIDEVHRNWNAAVRDLCKLFPGTVSDKVSKAKADEPHRDIKCRHIVLPWDDYDLNGGSRGQRKLPFVSIYIDCENDTILEEVGQHSLGYVIPRWQTVSGSQYAHSPAVVVALPDARLLQQITLTLLESGQKAADPPMVAVAEAIMGGANLGAGMITWADAEFDGKLEDVMAPLMSGHKALEWGTDREERIVKAIHAAFYLDQINMPYPEKGMTATEYRGRIEEYVRRALPLFEPMETEYNGGLCNETFDLAMRMGIFGPREDMPPILSKQEIKFTFDSPLQSANERAKAEALVASANLLSAIAPIDQGVAFNVDWNKGFREALPAIGLAADLLIDEKVAAQARQGAQQAKQMQAMAGMVGQGAGIADTVGKAGKSLQEAGIM